MPYTIAGKNTMLDALSAAYASLHTAFPGDAGANEVAGGTYARKAITIAAASAGSRDSSTQPIFDIPPGVTFAFWSIWTAVSGGACLGFGAVGGAIIPYSVDAAGNNIRSVAHGLAGGDRVVLVEGTPPTGLAIGTVYYVVNASADEFQLSLTEGGAAVDITGGNGSATLTSVAPQTAGPAGGQFTLSDADLYV